MHTAPASRSETRNGTRYILIAISLVGLAVIIWKLSVVITMAFGGVVGAAVLRGLALPLARRSGLSQSCSLWLVLVSLCLVAGALGELFGNQVAEQAGEMERLIPVAVHQLADALDHSMVGREILLIFKEASIDSKTLTGVGVVAGGALHCVTEVLLVFFLSIYFAFSPREYVEGFLRLIPRPHRQRTKIALLKAGDALQRWLLAQLLAMVIIGVLVGSALGLLGVPLALLLGTLAGLLEFIPVLGAILFTIPGVLVAFTKGPPVALYALIIYIGVQQLESNIVVPLLQRWALRLPPAITLLSVAVGGVLLGVPGVIFAMPLAVVTIMLVKTLYVDNALEQK